MYTCGLNINISIEEKAIPHINTLGCVWSCGLSINISTEEKAIPHSICYKR